MRKILLIILLFPSLINYVTAQSWSSLGAGIGFGYLHSVHSFATYNGELYVGGYFTTADGMPVNNIAKWNGTNWSNVDAGINGDVLSLCVFNGELYAGGYFSNAITRWNGTNWANVGSPDCYSVKSLAIYNGELYAAGYFMFPTTPDGTSIAKWNGTTWSPVGNGVEHIINSVECLAVYNGELYVAGAQIGGGGVAVNYSILRWDGYNWTTLITLPASYTLDGALGDILSMTVYNDDLYIAGTFGMMIDTVSIYQIAKWNGTNWSAVGTGINPESYPFGGDSDGSAYSFVSSLGVYNGALYAGGRFGSAGTIETRNIAKWDGTSWSALGQGVNGFVYDLIAFDSSLYVGGWFNYVNGNFPANKIAKWTTSCKTSPSQPGKITGNTLVCSGSTQTYSISPISTASNYIWNLPSGWSGYSTTNSITVIAGTSDGIISVVANNNCGSSNPQILPVKIGIIHTLESPPINGNTSVCQGSTQTYLIGPIPGVSKYIWDLPTGWVGNSTTSSITTTVGNQGGDIKVGLVSNGCEFVSRLSFLTIDVNEIPTQPALIFGNIYVNNGNPEIYSVNSVNGATSYVWSLSGGGTIATGQGTNSVNIKWATQGNHVLSVKTSNNCGTSTEQKINIKMSETGGDDLYEIKLTPNPTSGVFYLKAKRVQNKLISVDVMNMMGQSIYHGRPITGANDYTQSINLDKMPQGVYVVKITLDNKVFVRRQIVVKPGM